MKDTTSTAVATMHGAASLPAKLAGAAAKLWQSASEDGGPPVSIWVRANNGMVVMLRQELPRELEEAVDFAVQQLLTEWTLRRN